MRGELQLGLPALYGFLLVLARIGSAIIFVPLPGLKSSPEAARAVLALILTLCLFPQWPVPQQSSVSIGILVMWLLAEAAFGLTAGLTVMFLFEGLQLGAQIIGLQAGFSY